MGYYFNVNRECFNCANDAAWSLKDINYSLKKSSFYNLYLKDLTMEDVFVKAISFAKKDEYVDMILKRMARKNGQDFAIKIFKIVFADFKFNNLDDLFDYCYHLCQKEKDIKPIALEIGININRIRYYAKESKLGMLDEDIMRRDKRKNTVKNNYPIDYKVIKYLMEHDDKDEIIAFFDKLDIEYKPKNLMGMSCAMYPDMSFEEIKNTVYKRFHEYSYYRKYVLNADDSAKKYAYGIIRKFIGGDYANVFFFCEMEKISKTQFYYYYNVVKKYNQELYKAYVKKIDEIKKNKYTIRKDEIKMIAKYIINGIDGREFNILDFYQSTKYSLKEFFFYARSILDEFEMYYVRAFYNRYKNMEILSVKDILEEGREFYCDIDEKGLPIQYTGHTATDDEKLEVIEQIKNDGYKLYGPIYNIYLKNYFNEEKGKTLKKKL